MKIGIVTNSNIKDYKKVLEILKESLTKSELKFEAADIDNLKTGYDFVCAIGGDGTILKTSRFYSKTGTPVMGINLGRLGFLSLVHPNDLLNIGEVIKKGQYNIRERMMLNSDGNTALNDIVIKGHSSARTSEFKLYINNNPVSDYIADGLIISTPTGSTAYGLSAGGPILHPGLDAMVIVPICAHTMTARPLVIPGKEIVTVKSKEESFDIIFDGQTTIKKLHEVNITKSENKAKLVFPHDYKFYNVLKNKLHWGVSPISE